ncbi:MAG: tRNA lysidine(34) synthetase TilS [Blastocatellia bacterium]|nr:tRNA lysidine(34) synthetase TilS [Blastocatellia bacterium]
MRKEILYKKVVEEISRKRLFAAENSVLVALSGGADSVALLFLLKEIRDKLWTNLKLHIVHLNHKLRGEESDRDEEFVRRIGQRLDLPTSIESIDVADRALRSGSNIEASGRKARYDFFQRVCKEVGAECVATAHTMNDQAETFLMRLIRGAGPSGLAGIHSKIEFQLSGGKVNIVRPLLNVKRVEIETYLEEIQEPFCQDSSNFLLDYRRNRIRHQIMPILTELNPKIIDTLSKNADLLKEDFADNLAICKENKRLSIKMLHQLSHSSARWAVRDFIKQNLGHLDKIERTHIEAVTNLANSVSGKKIELPGKYQVVREFDHLTIYQKKTYEKSLEPLHLELNQTKLFGLFSVSFENSFEESSIEVESGPESWYASIDLSKTGNFLCVRSRKEGDRYKPYGHNKLYKVKDLMIEKRIPVGLRQQWPVITTKQDEIVWIPSFAVAANFLAQATAREKAVIKVLKHIDD